MDCRSRHFSKWTRALLRTVWRYCRRNQRESCKSLWLELRNTWKFGSARRVSSTSYSKVNLNQRVMPSRSLASFYPSVLRINSISSTQLDNLFAVLRRRANRSLAGTLTMLTRLHLFMLKKRVCGAQANTFYSAMNRRAEKSSISIIIFAMTKSTISSWRQSVDKWCSIPYWRVRISKSVYFQTRATPCCIITSLSLLVSLYQCVPSSLTDKAP